MASQSLAVSTVVAVVIFVGLAIRFVTRKKSPSGAADSTTDHVVGEGSAHLQEKDGDTDCKSSDATGTVHRTEQLSTSLQRRAMADPGHEFEVFLSFRGEDIRKTFTDYLYHALVDAGVRTFRDNEELHVGKEIGPELMTAITRSMISMPIFTEGYASSEWCLRELAEMVRCMKETGGKHTIMPIFFDVAPHVVRHQTGAYARSFSKHESSNSSETVKEWRNALADVSNLKGLELNKATNGHQGEFSQLVVVKVLRELRQSRVDVSRDFVGLDDPAEKLMQQLEDDVEDVRMVGIWGTGGIGKTTLAKCVYHRMATNFRYCSLLEDIRATSAIPGGLVGLQNKLIADILGSHKYDVTNIDDGKEVLKKRIRGKKALILLDDVDHINQLKALAEDLGWFGLGSRILVTTRGKDVLQLQFPDCSIHEVQPLNDDRALELFCKHAFRQESPPAEFADLSIKIARSTGGLPQTLEVIGSSLFPNRGKKVVWVETLKQLESEPPSEVQHKLRISYDALTKQQKDIFLDIACFFIGWDYEMVAPMWDDCNFFPASGIEALCLKSLIKIVNDNELRMHDQLRDLGRHIVMQENDREPQLRSRLWQSTEAVEILLRGHQGTSNIEAATIWAEGATFSAECFQNLSKLRILMLRDVVQLDGNFEHLLPKLRWLSLSTKNLVPLPASLPLHHLIVLCLSNSSVDEEWIGWRSQ